MVKTFDVFLVYSVLILSFPHFSCTSWLFPKCKFAFFKVLAKLSPFLECFFPLETLLKPKATPIKKKKSRPPRNLWLYNDLLCPFLHMAYVLFLY